MKDSLLFVTADRREFAPWVARWDDVRPVDLPVHWARKGTWRARPVLAIANGMGPERAYQAVLAAREAAYAVCSVGLCGALDETLKIADVFVGTEIRNGSFRSAAALPLAPRAASGRVVSLDHVAQTAREKRDLRSAGASIVEMEAAGAARAARELGISFYCIKVVSDLASEDFANNFNAARRENGTVNVPSLLLHALASPRARFSELIRVAGRMSLASEKLGEFLANCSF